MKLNTKAQSILNRIKYATLATVDADGNPWNAPVYFIYNEDYNLYWASVTQSQHSQNIKANGKVFIVVYDSTVPWSTDTGVYIEAVASEVTDPQVLAKACQLRKARVPEANQPPEAFMGDSPRRIYCAKPQHIWLNTGDKVDGHFIDTRVEATV